MEDSNTGQCSMEIFGPPGQLGAEINIQDHERSGRRVRQLVSRGFGYRTLQVGDLRHLTRSGRGVPCSVLLAS